MITIQKELSLPLSSSGSLSELFRPTTGLPGICPDGTLAINIVMKPQRMKINFHIRSLMRMDLVLLKVIITVNPVNDCPFVDGEAIKLNRVKRLLELTLGVLDPEYTLGLDLVLT